MGNINLKNKVFKLSTLLVLLVFSSGCLKLSKDSASTSSNGSSSVAPKAVRINLNAHVRLNVEDILEGTDQLSYDLVTIQSGDFHKKSYDRDEIQGLQTIGMSPNREGQFTVTFFSEGQVVRTGVVR